MGHYVGIMVGLLIGASCLSQAYADEITTFDISGTVTPVSPQTGTTFSGNVVVDETFDYVLSGDLNFPDLPTLAFSGTGGSLGPPATYTFDFASTGFNPINASLSVDVPTAFSLAGFTGGSILLPGDNVASFYGKETIYYTVTGGSLTPETAAVPEPSSFVMVLGFMALIFVARRRHFAAGR
jgi:hypothetical protein